MRDKEAQFGRIRQHVCLNLVREPVGADNVRDEFTVVCAQYMAFFEDPFGKSGAVSENGAFRLVKRDGAELHEANVSSLPCLAAMISPRIETAISAGEEAPKSNPIGPLIRKKASSPKPISVKRSSREACVRLLPKEPI